MAVLRMGSPAPWLCERRSITDKSVDAHIVAEIGLGDMRGRVHLIFNRTDICVSDDTISRHIAKEYTQVLH